MDSDSTVSTTTPKSEYFEQVVEKFEELFKNLNKIIDRYEKLKLQDESKELENEH